MIGGLSRMQREMDRRDVWLLDTGNYEWTHLADGAPPSAFNFGMDTESEQVVAFNLYPTETWVYDLAKGSWRQETPAVQPETTSANPRFGTPLTYDAESDRLILFAGGSPWHMYSETWAHDANLASWELMTPEPSPSPRAMYATAYDAESDRVLLWGGFTGTDENDVRMWAYDYNSDTWTEIDVDTSPPALAMYDMAYDEATGTVVLYAGEMTSKHAGNLSSDVWVFDPAVADWSVVKAPEG